MGIGLSAVATRKLTAVAETTTGTTQGSSSNTLKTPLNGTSVRSSNAMPRPTIQLPNTPTSVKITVNLAAAQKSALCRTAE